MDCSSIIKKKTLKRMKGGDGKENYVRRSFL